MKDSMGTQDSSARKKRKKRILKYLNQNQFSSNSEIYQNSDASRNWQDVQEDLVELLDDKIIESRIFWNWPVYFTKDIRGGLDHTVRTFLRIKNHVLSLVESKKDLRNTAQYREFLEFYKIYNVSKIPKSKFSQKLKPYKYDLSSEDILSQVLGKFLDLYYLRTSILIKKETEQNSIHSEMITQGRMGGISSLLHEFERLLQDYSDETARHLAEFLDDSYRTDLDFYKRISSGTRWNSTSLVELQYIAMSQSKKDAAEYFDISMKQTGNALKLSQDKTGEINYPYLLELRSKENATSAGFMDTPDMDDLMWLEDMKKALRAARKNPRKYRQIKKEAGMFFPSIDFDHLEI